MVTTSESEYTKTTNIREIKRWAKQRDGQPAIIKDTDILKIKLADEQYHHHDLEEISWDRFAELFNQHYCLFLYEQDQNSNFYKVIARSTIIADTDIAEDGQRLAKL